MISASIIVTTPLNGWVFRFGEDLTYEHGSMFIFLYVIAEMYLLSAFIITVIHRKKLSKDKAVSSFCFFGGSIMAVFIQIFIPEIIITQFTAAVTILIIYMTLQNPEDYFDRNTGTFNRRAFMEIFGEKAREDKSIDIVALKIFDMDYLSHTLGSDSADEILKNAIAGLYALRGKAMFFKYRIQKYAFLCDREENIFDHLPRRLKSFFQKPFSHGGAFDNSFRADLLYLMPGNRHLCPMRVFSMIDYYLEVKVKDGQENVNVGRKAGARKAQPREKLLNAWRRAILSDGFYVVYQPILFGCRGRLFGG